MLVLVNEVLYGPAALGGATKPGAAAAASPTSSRHASSPPVSAAAWNPIFSSCRAARALDASSGQVQYATTSRSRACFAAQFSTSSRGTCTPPGIPCGSLA